MKKNEITAATAEITARDNATAAMKKEGEKKMEKPATITAARAALLDTARAAARNYDNVHNDDTSVLKAVKAVDKAMNDALKALNDDMLTEVYTTAMAAPSPMAALAKTAFYPKWNKKTVKGVTSLETRETRLNVVDFIDWAADNDSPLKNADAVKTALADTARKVADYVLAEITTDKGGSVRATLPAMEKLFKAMNLDVHANGKDVRFIGFAATKARKLGELAEITADTVTPFIMDVVTIRERGIEYSFEKKEENA